MKAFLTFIVEKPLFIIIIVVFMALTGVYSARHIPVDLFPNLDIPVINIISHFPGASPEDIEQLISRPIEDEIHSIQNIKRISSTSVQGISEVTVEFNWGTTVQDARQLVQSKLGQLSNRLPSEVFPRIENIGTTLQEVCGYTIYGGADLITLRNIVEHDITGRLMSVEGVSSVETLGGNKRAFLVTVEPEKLIAFHLKLSEIAKVLKENNKSSVPGYATQFGNEYLIRGNGRLKTLNDIRMLPLTKKGAKSILLEDVAKVSEDIVPKHYIIRGDTYPAVVMIIRKQPGASTIRVVAGIEQAVKKLKKLLPPETRVKKFYDQSEIIKESQNEIMYDLAIGALLAFFVLYFFLGALRPTFIVAITIPITFLTTIAIMRILNQSLNVITMTALTLAIGMIVDDAIVVVENIFRHDRTSVSTKNASINGALEIAGPDASGTITTIAAFSPLIFITGIAALFIRPFGLTISIALFISLLLSLTIVPLLFSKFGNKSLEKQNSLGNKLLLKIDEMIQNTLIFSFNHKKLVIGLAIFSVVIAGLTTLADKIDVLPPIDEGAILIEYVMPPGTSLKESNRISEYLDKIALSNNDVSCLYRRTGSPGKGYQIEGVNKGELLIKLKPKNLRKQSISEIMASLKASYSKFSGIVFLYHQPTQEKIDESFSGLPAIFGITIYGSDMKTLISLAGKVEKICLKNPSISNLVNNTKIKVPTIEVNIRYPQLAQYNVNMEAVLNTLKASRTGIEATKIIRQKEEVAVLIKMPVKGTFNAKFIKQLPIETNDGKWIPLKQVAEVIVNNMPSSITRLNGQRQITLLAEINGNIFAIVNELRQQFQAMKIPEGYSIDFTGQYKVLFETGIEMLFAVLIAVVLIYLIMVMQFGSWLQPMVIIFTIPLSLVGALISLFVTNQGIDVSVGMGIVTLVGIAVNNAIVLIDYANRNPQINTKLSKAISSAASVRLRPILLTTFTTIAALIPTAIGTTVGSKIFQPFAITVIGGLISGVIATLIIIPTIAVLILEKK